MRQGILVILAGAALSAAFWDPLWRGAGFVGGDVYSYYFPQKTYYAERLRDGELPLWNPLAGHGYPVLGESQTGVFYPFHLVLYRTLDVHTAYHVNHLIHYMLAFAATVALARTLGLSRVGAMFAGLVYAYGWFPSRTCWEWAILGGAWLPAALWCLERLLRSDSVRDVVLLSVVLALQMLAGHYHIAFMTQLLVVFWALGRLTFARPAVVVSEAETSSASASTGRGRGALLTLAALALGFGLAAVQLLPTASLKSHSQRTKLGELHNPSRGLIPPGCLTQIVGWVRTASPDASEATTWQPWASPLVNRDAELQRRSDGTPTNQVEAQLGFGLVPLGLALVGIVTALCRRDRALLLWLGIGLAGLVYATGLLVPWTQHLPGFGWFHGPGRYGLLTTLAGAILAGSGLDALCGYALPATATSPRGRLAILGFSAAWLAFALLTLLALSASVEQFVSLTGNPSPLVLFGIGLSDSVMIGILVVTMGAAIIAFGLVARSSTGEETPLRPGDQVKPPPGSAVLAAVLFGVSFLDLWMTSRLVTYSPMVANPPLVHVAESPVGRALHNDPVHPASTVRLFAPGGNLPTILGVGSTPPYFTFCPAEYADPALALPAADDEQHESPGSIERRVAWLQRAGVTHILSFKPLDRKRWPVDPLWSGIDPFLNPAWGRYGEPLYLYRLLDTRGRAATSEFDDANRITVTSSRANRVVLSVELARDGELILTDLFDRDWTATVDDAAAEAERFEGMFRTVKVPAGRHVVEWTYRPWSVTWGAGISLLTLIVAVVVAWRFKSRRI